MRNILLLFIIFYSAFSFCQQTYQATYSISYNTERPTSKKAILQIADTQYTYIEGTPSKRIVDNESDETKISVRFRSSGEYNITNLVSDSIYSKVNIRGKDYYLGEPKPLFNWILLQEVKTIETYKLKKATLSFRGRDYIAWYSEDIPTSAGPWKFSGLPGLIFEIHDTTNRINWQLTELTSTITETIMPSCENCPKIDLKKYCYLRYEKPFDNSSFLRNLPRGATVTTTSIPRNDIETKFEWED